MIYSCCFKSSITLGLLSPRPLVVLLSFCCLVVFLLNTCCLTKYPRDVASGGSSGPGGFLTTPPQTRCCNQNTKEQILKMAFAMLQIRVFRPPSISWYFSKLSPTWLISLSRVHYINLVLSDALCNIIVDPSNSLLPPRKATFVSGGVPTRNAVWSETLETGPFAIVNVLETWISKKKKNTLSHPQPMTLWYCGQKPCRRRTGPFAIVIVHSTRH